MITKPALQWLVVGVLGLATITATKHLLGAYLERK